MTTQKVAMDEFEVDSTFNTVYTDLKVKRRFNVILMRIVDGNKIKIMETKTLVSPRKLHDYLDDVSCYFIVYNAPMDKSEGGKRIDTEKLFLLTFMPSFAHPQETVVYETQKGKTMEKLVKGSISLNIRSKDELLNVLQAQLKPKEGKGRFDESEEEYDEDWMDN